jgi:hypothetical protein
MSSLATYYKLGSVLFLVDAVIDIIFNSTFSSCPYTNSATGLFFFMFLLNIFIFLIMLATGLILTNFDALDPDEYTNLGIVKKFLGIFSKILPRVIKLLHLLKIFIVLGGAYYAYFNKSLSLSYFTDNTLNWTELNQTYCGVYDSPLHKATNDSYIQQIPFFEGVEIGSVFISLCILGLVKNSINIEGYFYEPEDLSHGFCRKLWCRSFGP